MLIQTLYSLLYDGSALYDSSVDVVELQSEYGGSGGVYLRAVDRMKGLE